MDVDAELLEALKRGSETAWDEAFKRLYPCAYTAALHPSATLTPSEAEDVAIETLSELVSKVGSVKIFDELKALAVTMSSRRAFSEARRKYAAKRGGNQTSSLEQITEESGGAFEPSVPCLDSLNSTDLIELSRLLQEALVRLDDPTRDMIHDFLLHGMPYKDLAAKYKIAIGTVGVNLSRGLRRVRDQLEEFPQLMKELRLFLR